MILLVTDFGLEGPYVGQMTAAIYREDPEVRVVNLFADAPVHNPRAAAHLLAAYAGDFPSGSVFLCVVDPAVGSTAQMPVVVSAGDYWFVGPANGLFDTVAARVGRARWWRIDWRPGTLSNSFHGRDLYAPVAARLARGDQPPGTPLEMDVGPAAGGDLPEVIYIDNFGNCMTGIRAFGAGKAQLLDVAGHRLSRARTFSDVPEGGPFWYENANGLLEIAVNRGRADASLGLRLGDPVGLIDRTV